MKYASQIETLLIQSQFEQRIFRFGFWACAACLTASAVMFNLI